VLLERHFLLVERLLGNLDCLIHVSDEPCMGLFDLQADERTHYALAEAWLDFLATELAEVDRPRLEIREQVVKARAPREGRAITTAPPRPLPEVPEF
jgi:hypothetical protein